MQKSGLVKSSKYAWVVLILLVLMQFVYAGITLSTVTLYMEPILNAHPEVSRTAYALTITLNGGANAIVSIFFGKLVDKFGLKKMISFCSILMIAGVILYANGTAIWMFYLAAILQGISLCFCSGASCSIIFSKWFAHSTGTLLSATAIGSGLAGVIFSPIVSNWINTIGWTTSLYINCAIVVFTAIILIVFLKDSPEEYGVKPMWNDKVKIADESGAIIPYGVTAKEAYKTVQFWCGTIGIGVFGLIIYGAICNIAIFSSDLGYDGGVMLCHVRSKHCAAAAVRHPRRQAWHPCLHGRVLDHGYRIGVHLCYRTCHRHDVFRHHPSRRLVLHPQSNPPRLHPADLRQPRTGSAHGHHDRRYELRCCLRYARTERCI